MSNSADAFGAGDVITIGATEKSTWELGQIRTIARGTLTETGQLAADTSADPDWEVSIRSILQAGSYTSSLGSQVTTLIAGDFIQLEVAGQQHGLEPLRPLKFATDQPVAATQPAMELLLLHVAANPDRVRATVRIVELSKKRDQYLFDGQLGMLVEGSATLTLNDLQRPLGLRDTVIGSDSAEPTVSGRGFLAVISFDLP